jgi:hypothetical protein
VIKRHLVKSKNLQLKVESIEGRRIKDEQVEYLLKFEGFASDDKDPFNWAVKEVCAPDVQALIEEYERELSAKGGLQNRANSLIGNAVASKRKASTLEAVVKKQKTKD